TADKPHQLRQFRQILAHHHHHQVDGRHLAAKSLLRGGQPVKIGNHAVEVGPGANALVCLRGSAVDLTVQASEPTRDTGFGATVRLHGEIGVNADADATICGSPHHVEEARVEHGFSRSPEVKLPE